VPQEDKTMVNRRKVLTALGALSAGSAAAVGTGAFSVQANRGLTIDVAEESRAYLSFANPRTDIGHVQRTSRNGLQFDFTADSATYGAGGDGLTINADTEFRDLFDIVNRGPLSVDLWVATADPCGLYEDIEVKVNTIEGADETDVSKPGKYITLDPGNQRSVDLLFHTDDSGLRDRASEDETFEGTLQFVARDTKQNVDLGADCGGERPGPWRKEPIGEDSKRFDND
jgi:hypothetical protein